ncbi:MAG: ankyrin repeat domain-containing protein [Gemmataceae bacterium]|nr:ankyrin repeat domain-containing protein [Gemmataceae bacterium]
MSDSISRRAFTARAAGLVLAPASPLLADDDKPKTDPPKAPMPTEAPFERDYTAPRFNPSWKKQQLNRLLVQDFVIFAHSDLDMTKKLLEKEPLLVNAFMDWGGGDWESGLGGASHVGRRDIVELLLEKGARIDIFCAAMMGQLEAVKAFLTLQPKLIDARGPHGISLHFHAHVGGKHAEPVLEYLQSIKKVEFKPIPKKPVDPPKKSE